MTSSTPPSLTEEWYYRRGESAFGPVGGVILHDLIRRGRLRDDALVRREGTEEWITVAQARPSLPLAPQVLLPSAVSQPQPLAETLSFDSTLPGASAVYAPPQAVLTDLPGDLHPPFYLRLSVAAVAFIITAGVLMWMVAMTIQACDLLGIQSLPGWLLRAAALIFPQHEVSYLALAVPAQTLCIIIWQGCAFTSLRRLYGDGMVRRSAASGLWWIVPIATLFMPLFCLRDLRYLSRKRRDFFHPHASFGPLLVWFEVLLLVDIPFNVVSAMQRFQAAPDRELGTDAEPTAFQSVVELVSNCHAIVFSLVVLAIVIRNFRQQKALFRYWHDDDHWTGR